jgi:predicted dehydrogenase
MTAGGRPPLRIGLAGAGMISHHHLIAWSRDSRAKVVALCDPDLAQAQRRAAEFAIPGVHATLDEMLARHELDAVDVASPRETHAALVEAAAARGIDVRCRRGPRPTRGGEGPADGA